MNPDTRELLGTFGMVIFLILFLATVLFGVTWAGSWDACNTLDGYGYVTEIDNFNCYVIMQDGTRIFHADFHIADFKEPRLK